MKKKGKIKKDKGSNWMAEAPILGIPYPESMMRKNKKRILKPKIKERELKSQILQYLNLKGIFCWNNRTVGIKKEDGQFIPANLVGISDILGILKEYNGKFLAIECKVKPNKLTPAQKAFLEKINKNNGIGIVACSIDDVKNILEGMKNGRKIRERNNLRKSIDKM